MKKFLVVVVLVLAGISANAQWYVGGSINFNVATDKNSDGDKLNTVTTFGLNPEVGYYLNDRFDLGLDLNIGNTTNKDHQADTKIKTFTWGLTPYARYSIIQWNNFELIARAALNLGGSTTDNAGTKTTRTNIGLNITPVVAYNLNDHVTFFTNLNFARFGFNSTKVKDGGSSFDFGFRANANNLVTLGDITVGCIYKF